MSSLPLDTKETSKPGEAERAAVREPVQATRAVGRIGTVPAVFLGCGGPRVGVVVAGLVLLTWAGPVVASVSVVTAGT